MNLSESIMYAYLLTICESESNIIQEVVGTYPNWELAYQGFVDFCKKQKSADKNASKFVDCKENLQQKIKQPTRDTEFIHLCMSKDGTLVLNMERWHSSLIESLSRVSIINRLSIRNIKKAEIEEVEEDTSNQPKKRKTIKPMKV